MKLATKTKGMAADRKAVAKLELHAPLFATCQQCSYGVHGAFTKPDAKCAGVVTMEGNRLPLCSRHRLASAFECQQDLARKMQELQDRMVAMNARVRALTALL